MFQAYQAKENPILDYIHRHVDQFKTEDKKLKEAFDLGYDMGSKPNYGIPENISTTRMVNKARHILAKFGTMDEKVVYGEGYLRRKKDEEELNTIQGLTGRKEAS